MNKGEILRMATESYCSHVNLMTDQVASISRLMRFAKLVAAAEREACAKRLDAIGCDHCAENIRLRDKE